MPTTTPTPYPCEWFHNTDDVPHYYTEEEVKEAESRIKPERDEPIDLSAYQSERQRRFSLPKRKP